jgi:hypothetical protein
VEPLVSHAKGAKSMIRTEVKPTVGAPVEPVAEEETAEEEVKS